RMWASSLAGLSGRSARWGGGQLQLAAQEVPRLAEVVRGRVQQTLVQRADVGLIGLVLGQCLHGRILCGGCLFRAARRGKIQGKSEVAGDRGQSSLRGEVISL